MPAKEFLCKKCGDIHKRPINSKCPFVNAMGSEQNSQIEHSPSVCSLTRQKAENDLNVQILAELKSLGGRMTAMEQKMSDTSPAEVNQRSQASHAASAAAVNPSPAQLEEVVVPSVATLQGTSHIQAEVNRRLKHLAELNEAGKLKSQRGGTDTVWVKKQVPWPQNFVLGGNNKSRMSYDNLSWCQWVSGFAMIAREENNIQTKNAMLDYLSEIMEDANDFSWQSAKASHAVRLCRIEKGKVDWSNTTKIDRIRLAHAQRVPPQNLSSNSKPKSEFKTMVCRFYQKGTCQKDKDHETGQFFYKHVCATCFSMGKEYRHMAKDCRVSLKPAKND